MVNYEHIFNDKDAAKVSVICLGAGISLQAFELWCRAAAFAYYSDPTEKSVVLQKGLYNQVVCTHEERMEHFDELQEYGLARRDEKHGTLVICRPAKILARWEEEFGKDREEEQAVKFTVKAQKQPKQKCIQKELAFA